MIDWNPLVAAVTTLLISLAVAVPSFIALLNARLKAATDLINAQTDAATITITKQTDALLLKTDAVVAESKEIKHKVDGNYSDLKAEVLSAKAETILANQRIAVLTERLITSTPASATPPVAVAINGVGQQPIPVLHETVGAPVLVVPLGGGEKVPGKKKKR